MDGATGARPLCAQGHPGTGLPTGPTDGAARPRLSPTASAGSGSHFCCRRTIHWYAPSSMHFHDEQVARHHARQTHFPSLLSPSLPVCFLAARGPSLVPSLLLLSLPCSPCSLSPVYLLFSSPLCVPPLSRSAPGTLHDTVPDSFSSLRVRLDRGRACRPAAAFPQPPILHLYEPAPGAPPIFVGSGQRHWAQVTCHAALPLAPPLPLSLSLPWSALCLPLGPSLAALPLTRTLHNNVQGTLPSSCSAPLAVARTVHGNPLCSLAPLSVAFWPLLCPWLIPSASLPSLARPVSSFSSCSALPPLFVLLRPLSMMHDTHLFSDTSGHTLLLAQCTPLLALLFVPVARGQGRQEPVHPSLVRHSSYHVWLTSEAWCA